VRIPFPQAAPFNSSFSLFVLVARPFPLLFPPCCSWLHFFPWRWQSIRRPPCFWFFCRSCLGSFFFFATFYCFFARVFLSFVGHHAEKKLFSFPTKFWIIFLPLTIPFKGMTVFFSFMWLFCLALFFLFAPPCSPYTRNLGRLRMGSDPPHSPRFPHHAWQFFLVFGAFWGLFFSFLSWGTRRDAFNVLLFSPFRGHHSPPPFIFSFSHTTKTMVTACAASPVFQVKPRVSDFLGARVFFFSLPFFKTFGPILVSDNKGLIFFFLFGRYLPLFPPGQALLGISLVVGLPFRGSPPFFSDPTNLGCFFWFTVF